VAACERTKARWTPCSWAQKIPGFTRDTRRWEQGTVTVTRKSPLASAPSEKGSGDIEQEILGDQNPGYPERIFSCRVGLHRLRGPSAHRRRWRRRRGWGRKPSPPPPPRLPPRSARPSPAARRDTRCGYAPGHGGAGDTPHGYCRWRGVRGAHASHPRRRAVAHPTPLCHRHAGGRWELTDDHDSRSSVHTRSVRSHQWKQHGAHVIEIMILSE